MSTRRRIAAIGALVLPMVLTACPGDRDEQPQQSAPVATPTTQGAPTAAAGALPAGVTQEMVEEGRQIFHGQGICFTCHGQNAQGSQLGPNLADSEWIWLTGEGDRFEQLVGIIRTGVTQPREYPAPMPPMGGANLTDNQLRSVAGYVYSLNQW